MKLRGVSKLEGELPGKELSLALGALNEVTVSLPIRGVIQTLRSKIPCTEGKMSQRDHGTFRRGRGEFGDGWKGQRCDLGGRPSPEMGLLVPLVMVKTFNGKKE